MSSLLDSSFAIDLLAERPEAIALVPSLRNEGLAISIFTYMELWEGVFAHRDAARADQVLRAFLASVAILPFSRRVALRATRLRGELRRMRRPLEQRAIDILIAATALEHDLTMITSDTDFDDIPGLRRLNPRMTQ